MIAILLGLLVFIAVGIGLTFKLRGMPVAAKAEPTKRGAEQLSQLRWRDFARLVLQAMHSRGYRPVIEAGGPTDGIPTDGSDILLTRSGEKVLLSCQYGTGAIVNTQVISAAVSSASLRGAERVIVVTPGRFESGAAAGMALVELIDGETLWPEVRPYVAHPDEPMAPAPSASASGKSMAMAWGGAVVAGGIVWAVVNGIMPGDTAATTDTAATPTPVAAAAPAASPAAAPQDDRPAMPGVPTDVRELDERRKEAANAVATLFGVNRALWSSQSTLMVYLSSPDADPMNDICPLLEQYPELAASRIQLQPPEGSNKQVRFTHCRAY